MKKIILLSAALVLTGCASTYTKSSNSVTENSNQSCRYVERDLTANWDSRSYWCLPNGIKHTVIQPIVIPTEEILVEEVK